METAGPVTVAGTLPAFGKKIITLKEEEYLHITATRQGRMRTGITIGKCISWEGS